MTTALVIHGHFYQPPRENPWTELVEREAGASPFHDWNERIHVECYRPNAFARISDWHGRVERVVNNYARLSFNFGPTLLNWLERSHPETYARILEADRLSVLRYDGRTYTAPKEFVWGTPRAMPPGGDCRLVNFAVCPVSIQRR